VRAAFRNLYVLRAAMASCWIALVSAEDAGMAAGGGGGFRRGAALLLVAYPLLDAIGTVVDLRAGGNRVIGASRRIDVAAAQRANLALDLVAATAVGVAVASLAAAMDVLAGWAIVAGLLQLLVGAGRRRRIPGQWPMIVSGLGSIVGGTSFIGWSLSAVAALDRLVQYSIGGTVLYLVATLALLVSRRAEPPALSRSGAGSAGSERRPGAGPPVTSRRATPRRA
jgi:uncharacterized membrane protein HdeD (DUF308 family)